MLRKVKTIFGFDIMATDGIIGTCADIIFDELNWKVRYLALAGSVESTGRAIMLPVAICKLPDYSSGVFPVAATAEQIKSTPFSEIDKTITRDIEKQLARHFETGPYFVHGPTEGLPPREPLSGDQLDATDEAASLAEPHIDQSNKIRARELLSYRVRDRDDDVGAVDDLIFNGDTWRLQYIAARISTDDHPRHLLAIDWLQHVDRNTRTLQFAVGRTDILKSPEYDPRQGVNTALEENLYSAHGRQFSQ